MFGAKAIRGISNPDGEESVLETARSTAYRAVNTVMVQAYWHVGRLIVEHEQGGRRRAAYGGR